MSAWKELMSPDGIPYYFNSQTNVTQWDKPAELLGANETDASSWSWVLHPDEGWVVGQIMSTFGKSSYTAKRRDTGETFDHEWPKGTEAIPIPSLAALRKIVPDLVQLEHIDEPTIAHNLRERAKTNNIYTRVGDILISVNPYERLPIYTATIMDDYIHTADPDKLPPHVFAIAANTYNALREGLGNQSVLISGESGAGKTEATKVVLQYLAEVAGSPDGVEQMILQCNPVLEAFGNAKTLRNNNSSRFGKWMEVHMDPNKLTICGCKVTNYLLEKSRVVRQAASERNYHIFYQLCAGASPDQRQRYGLTEPEDFYYLNQSGCVRVDGIDDAADWAEMNAALSMLRFTEEEKESVFGLVAAILHLGNVTFVAEASDASQIENPDLLSLVAHLLQVDEGRLSTALISRTFTTTGRASFYTIPLKPNEAIASRDSLAKFLYGKLFDWLVRRVNQVLTANIPASGDTRMVGVLDIFGFEIFDVNSFEQLCINFTNERLQQHFNDHTFKLETAVYESEGIAFDAINFIDNQNVVELIEKKPRGILPALDEEVVMPKGSDESFLQKLHQNHADNPAYTKPLAERDNFVVHHYAGAVSYDSKNFLDKNRDTTYEGLVKVMESSGSEFIKAMFVDPEAAAAAAAAKTSRRRSGARHGPMLGRMGRGGRTGGGGTARASRKKTLGLGFRTQLAALMTTLKSTSPHFIRCIKPNTKKQPVRDCFNGAMVLRQLKYSGVMEAVAIRQAGFPFRWSHANFVQRFQCVDRSLVVSGTPQQQCQALLDAMNGDYSDVRIGKTMVLYRGTEQRRLELERNMAIERMVCKVQARCRQYLVARMVERLIPLREQLRAALKSGREEDLEAALSASDREAFAIREAVDARAKLERIREERRLNEELTVLLAKVGNRPEDHVGALEAIVMRIANIDLRTPEALQAKALYETVSVRAEVKQAVQEAHETYDEAALQAALDRAESVGVDMAQDYIQEALVFMEQLRAENALSARLRALMSLPEDLSQAPCLELEGSHLADGVSFSVQASSRGEATITAAAAAALDTAIADGDAAAPGSEHAVQALQGAKVVQALRRALASDDWDAVEQTVGLARAQGGLQTPETAAAMVQLSLRAQMGAVEEALAVAAEAMDRQALSVQLEKAAALGMEVVQYRALLQRIIQAQYALGIALRACDLPLLAVAIMEAEAFGYRGTDLTQAQNQFVVLHALVRDMRHEFRLLTSRQALQGVRDRATQLNMVTADTKRLDSLLDMGDEDFLKAQIKAAIEQGDTNRKLEHSIALKEILLARFAGSFGLRHFPLLKTPEAFAKAKHFGRDKLMESMLVWVKKPLPSTLSDVGPDPRLGKLALSAFKNLQAYCGDRHMQYPDMALEENMNLGRAHPELRSELYLHIVKQLTANTDGDSRDRAWRYLDSMLRSFPPGRFENYFEVWLKTQQHPTKENLRRQLHLHDDIFACGTCGLNLVDSAFTKSGDKVLCTSCSGGGPPARR